MECDRVSGLQKARQTFLPVIPLCLRNLDRIRWAEEERSAEDAAIKTLFPNTSGQPVLVGQEGSERSSRSLQVGVVLSGGQAAGGHNVITGLFDALQQLNPQSSRLLGFLDGPGGVVAGKYRELNAGTLAPYRNMGGFDMIGSGRTKIETQEQLSAALGVMKKMELDGLVVIGGDDSNTNAAVLAEYFLKNGCATKVVGVPKTIDGDLKNAWVGTSFGFDTACKTYSEIIGNIARDVASAKKYTHFIRLMGRSASHIALECALSTHPNLTLIGEEVAREKRTLAQITAEIADLICKREELGKPYGVILVPEGLIEFIAEVGELIKELNLLLAKTPPPLMEEISALLTPQSQRCFAVLPEKIQQQLLLHRDPHGNVQVSLIETERLLIDLVEKELQVRAERSGKKMKFFPVPHFFGYEGRAGYPSNFDCNYCYSLGLTAALLIHQGMTGYMACVSDLTRPPIEWKIRGVPLTALMKIEVRKGKEKPVIQKALVDLEGRPFLCFREQRERWKFEDSWCYPGPIQFFGDPGLTETVPMTLCLEAHG